MSQASSTTLNCSNNDLDCAICNDLLEEPKQLSRGHIFCYKCVLRLIEYAPPTTSRARVVYILCPNCRSQVSVPKTENLPTVYLIQGMVDKEKQTRAVNATQAPEPNKGECNSCSQLLPSEQLFSARLAIL
uniref:RING-type domain-containing protein n=1 Tax=Ditylenchus dipsaci TaxID=166011 RepID=A0A915CXK6_9BILA